MDEEVVDTEVSVEVVAESEPEPSNRVDYSQIAQEVVAGHWGRGNRRKERLRSAGFDPDAVQLQVDKIFNR